MSDLTNSGCACTPNPSIRCTVTSCAHHCRSAQYCGLETINVGTHLPESSAEQSTDCRSFEKTC